MNLQEIAFMVGLINANYHRRMAYLWVNIVAIAFSLAVIYYNSSVVDFDDAAASVLLFFFGIIGLFASLLRAMVVYALKNGWNDPGFPWSIRKIQMKALEEQAYAKRSSFEQLKHCVPLQEYFQMN